jgi:phenylalanyl-tRNA synthetase beta chain
MTISYHWLSEYLPERIEPERLSKILTSIGLEVESMEKYEAIKGGLEGLIIGEVRSCEQHPNADKLKITTVDTGADMPLQVVCGAANVAVGQKIVLAPVGATIYPMQGEPLTMKVAKIRGVESHGMICAEDEIGLGHRHDGILVLPNEAVVGSPAATYFQPYSDIIFEIGLTPNRMDAMSHLGVARDVCAYLAHHDKKALRAKQPNTNGFKADDQQKIISVEVRDPQACKRYAGLTITGVTIAPSPNWLQQKLKAIGLRPINNIVDITNFILHESGQPLHAFDADAITDNQIIVQKSNADARFVTLDEKERSLSDQDLLICNSTSPMCLAGVYGGLHSGVTEKTTNLFLESAWFDPTTIRRTSFRHGLRTDAATRFEKGVDISQTVQVLKRAALLIKEIAGGKISSDIVDVYPKIEERKQIGLKFHYLKKLSGKNYHPDAIKTILQGLGFEWVKESIDEITVLVPYSKPDITHPADIVEEILRIDGLDNVQIPGTVTMTPSIEQGKREKSKEKIAQVMVGMGFQEILTNSITNSAYFDDATLVHTVKMLNSLSAELNIMRPQMLPTGLESIAHNINRRQSDLRFFEFGKTYRSEQVGVYEETEHFCLYLTGQIQESSWNQSAAPANFYALKGMAEQILIQLGVKNWQWEASTFSTESAQVSVKDQVLLTAGLVPAHWLKRFDIKQPVYFMDMNWDAALLAAGKQEANFSPLPKQLPVYRDLAIVVDQQTAYHQVRGAVQSAKIQKLQTVKLFDVFESEKLGAGKKSFAINFTFLDEEKTLTDKEIDGMMQKIMHALEKECAATIRK